MPLHRPAIPLRAEQAGDVTLVTVLTAELGEANAEAAGRELLRLIDGVARPRLHLDLAAVRYLTSTALGLMVGLHNRVRAGGGELKLLNVASPVYEVFEVTRLHRLLDICRQGPDDRLPLPVAS